MRSDTVAAAVAAHYGVSKAQLLDASAEDLPLRMALGEAQVRQHTSNLTDTALLSKRVLHHMGLLWSAYAEHRLSTRRQHAAVPTPVH